MAMTVRLDETAQGALRAMAEREGLSQHEVIRRAILERAERAGRREAVGRSGERVAQRYADLLQRLSQ